MGTFGSSTLDAASWNVVGGSTLRFAGGGGGSFDIGGEYSVWSIWRNVSLLLLLLVMEDRVDTYNCTILTHNKTIPKQTGSMINIMVLLPA
jgi:hypothetical protein